MYDARGFLVSSYGIISSGLKIFLAVKFSTDLRGGYLFGILRGVNKLLNELIDAV